MLPLAYFYLFSGELLKAETLLKTFYQRTTAKNVTPYLRILLGNGYTFYSWLAGDFDRCYTFCEKTLTLAESIGIYGVNFFILAHGTAGALSANDLKRAEALLNKMGPQLDYVGAWSKGLFYNLSLWKDLIYGDLVRAKHNSDLALKYSEASGSPITSAAAHWARALVLNLSGKKQQADLRLDAALNLSDRFGSMQIKFGCLLTRARFAFERNEDTKAIQTLKRALSLGSQKSFFNTFFWLSDVMSFLCGKALENGIQAPYVQEIILKRRLTPQGCHLDLKNWPWSVRIYTLGRFEVQVNETPLVFKSKAPKKPLLLLKTIVALGSTNVSEDLLLDALWPQLDGDAAHSAFTSCLHRLRKILGNDAAIRVQEGKVSLNNQTSWVDLTSHELMLDEAETLWRRSTDNDEQIRAVRLTEEIMAQRPGIFLPGDSTPWIIAKREQLTANFLSCIRSLIQYYEAAKKWDRVVLVSKRGISVDPLAEDFYRELMSCYQQLNRTSEIIATYRSCQKNLSAYAGLKPSRETVDLYRSLI
jgi:DNA-binding SARP family transcriptional activator